MPFFRDFFVHSISTLASAGTKRLSDVRRLQLDPKYHRHQGHHGATRVEGVCGTPVWDHSMDLYVLHMSSVTCYCTGTWSSWATFYLLEGCTAVASFTVSRLFGVNIMLPSSCFNTFSVLPVLHNSVVYVIQRILSASGTYLLFI